MADQTPPPSEIVLYQTEDGRTRVECRLADETIWLTQALIAELFQVTPQNVTLHLKAIYEEREFDEAATCKDYLQVRSEGGCQVNSSPRLGWRSVVTGGARSEHEPVEVAQPMGKNVWRSLPRSRHESRASSQQIAASQEPRRRNTEATRILS
ncbi:MAG: hypothetical protein WD042_19600 [Phycisphaeraceae bacterium]